MELINGVVERLIYTDEQSGFTVAGLKTTTEFIKIVGKFSDLKVGCNLAVTGDFVTRDKGREFRVQTYSEVLPSTVEGIEAYLGSGLIDGIGEVLAKRIVEAFGCNTLTVLDTNIDWLSSVPGIGAARIQQIKDAWESQKSVRAVMLFLQSYGVSANFAVKIFKKWGISSIRVIRNNPYCLSDIKGVGFLSADEIARNLGIPPDCSYRIQSGIEYALEKAGLDGHCFLPLPKLLKKTTDLLSFPGFYFNPALIDAELTDMVANEKIIQEESQNNPGLFGYYLPSTYRAEVGLAERLKGLLENPMFPDTTAVQGWLDGFLEDFEAETGTRFSAEQEKGVLQVSTSRVSILTGGPGCGKTATAKAIVGLWKSQGKRIALAAPTGRAAQRLSEMAGMEAQTIHRLLGASPMGFTFDASNQLNFDAIGVDEASMLDVFLANALLRAINPKLTQLVFVGDEDQLSSVGPGYVLGDMIRSNVVPVTRLTEVFRQAKESAIICHAHTINKGIVPVFDSIDPLDPNLPSDAIFIPAKDAADGMAIIARLVEHQIPRWGFAESDIQIISPQVKGEIGTKAINKAMQPIFNNAHPDKAEIVFEDVIFRVGDSIIQTVNDYNKEVFNGELGAISAINSQEGKIRNRFETSASYDSYGDEFDRLIEYDRNQWQQFLHSFCISGHKCVAGYGLASIKGRGLVPVEDCKPNQLAQTGIAGYHQIIDHVQTGNRKIFRLQTKAGFSVDVSAEHPILVASANSLPRFCRAEELTEGMFACIDRSIAEGQDIEFPQPEYSNLEKRLNLPKLLSETMAWAIGAMVGDANCSDRKDGMIDLTNQDVELIRVYKTQMESLGLKVTSKPKPENEKTKRIYFCSKPLRRSLERLGMGYELSPAKRIPRAIFGATVSVRGAFLKGLFDTDGSCGGIKVRFTTSSIQLAKDVQTLLLSLGVASYRSSQNERHHKVAVSGPSILPFAERVGFSIGYKQEALMLLLQRSVLAEGRSNNDIIPFSDYLIKDFKVALPLCRGRKGQGAWASGSTKLYFLNKKTQRLSYRHTQLMLNYASENGLVLPEAIAETHKTHYFYDPIVKIERLEEAVVMYDMEIDCCHSFTVNGFVCHNSQGSEFTVVIVPLFMSAYMLLTRQWLYTILPRAKKLVVIVGEQKAIASAVRQNKDGCRHTLLHQRLQEN